MGPRRPIFQSGLTLRSEPAHPPIRSLARHSDRGGSRCHRPSQRHYPINQQSPPERCQPRITVSHESLPRLGALSPQTEPGGSHPVKCQQRPWEGHLGERRHSTSPDCPHPGPTATGPPRWGHLLLRPSVAACVRRSSHDTLFVPLEGKVDSERSSEDGWRETAIPASPVDYRVPALPHPDSGSAGATPPSGRGR